MVEVAEELNVSTAAANAATLERELGWLSAVIHVRLAATPDTTAPFGTLIRAPELQPHESIYANFVHHYEMCDEERLCIVLALAPHVRPHLLDPFFQPNELLNRGHSEFGGVHGKMHGGFLPTGETALFLLAGDDLVRRLECQQLFDRDHRFASHNNPAARARARRRAAAVWSTGDRRRDRRFPHHRRAAQARLQP